MNIFNYLSRSTAISEQLYEGAQGVEITPTVDQSRLKACFSRSERTVYVKKAARNYYHIRV